MPRSTTENAIQRDTLKNTIDKSKWHSNKCLSSPQEVRKRKQRNEKQRSQTVNRNKMADLSPNISIITFNINHLNMPIKRDRQSDFKNITNYIISNRMI